MNRLLRVIFILLIVMGLAACSYPPDVTPSSTPSQTVSSVPTKTATISALPTVSPSPSPSPLPTNTATPEPAPAFVPDTDIPNVEPQGDYTANSDCDIYEDENIICFMCGFYGDDLFLYDKANRMQKIISSNCNGFTVFNGRIYYINYHDWTEDADFFGYIKEYDPRTDETKEITRLNNDTISILAYNNRIYYSTCVDPESEDAYDIFSIRIDGKGNKKLGPESVDQFCISGDKLYYTSPNDMPPIYEYDLNSGKEKTLCTSSSQYCPFQVSGSKLYYGNFESDFIGCVDLDTGENTAIVDGPSEFTLAGQYVIYANDALYAYDINTGKTYSLLEVEDYEFQLYATENSAYIAFEKEDCIELDRIVISSGNASLELIAEFTGGTEQ